MKDKSHFVWTTGQIPKFQDLPWPKTEKLQKVIFQEQIFFYVMNKQWIYHKTRHQLIDYAIIIYEPYSFIFTIFPQIHMCLNQWSDRHHVAVKFSVFSWSNTVAVPLIHDMMVMDVLLSWVKCFHHFSLVPKCGFSANVLYILRMWCMWCDQSADLWLKDRDVLMRFFFAVHDSVLIIRRSAGDCLSRSAAE